MSTLNYVHDEGEVQESSVHDIKLFEPSEDAAEAFEYPAYSSDFLDPHSIIFDKRVRPC